MFSPSLKKSNILIYILHLHLHFPAIRTYLHTTSWEPQIYIIHTQDIFCLDIFDQHSLTSKKCEFLTSCLENPFIHFWDLNTHATVCSFCVCVCLCACVCKFWRVCVCIFNISKVWRPLLALWSSRWRSCQMWWSSPFSASVSLPSLVCSSSWEICGTSVSSGPSTSQKYTRPMAPMHSTGMSTSWMRVSFYLVCHTNYKNSLLFFSIL